MIKVILIIVWLLAGLIAVWRMYHGLLKQWYHQFGESYWDFHKRNGSSAVASLLYMSPFFIICGPISLMLELIYNDTCWWFTTKDKK